MGIFNQWLCPNVECSHIRPVKEGSTCPNCGTPSKKFGFHEGTDLMENKKNYGKLKKEVARKVMWYDDDTQLSHIEEYTDAKKASFQANEAAKKGWMPTGTAATDGHLNTGTAALGALMFGGLGLLAGATSRTKGKITITYTK